MSNTTAARAPIAQWHPVKGEARSVLSTAEGARPTTRMPAAQGQAGAEYEQQKHKGTFDPNTWLPKTAQIRADAAAGTGKWAPKVPKDRPAVQRAEITDKYKPVVARGAAAPRPLDDLPTYSEALLYRRERAGGTAAGARSAGVGVAQVACAVSAEPGLASLSAAPVLSRSNLATSAFVRAPLVEAIDHDLVEVELDEPDAECGGFLVEHAGLQIQSDLMDTGRKVQGAFLDAFAAIIDLPRTSERYQDQLDLEVARLAYNLMGACLDPGGRVRGVAVCRTPQVAGDLAHTRGASPMSYDQAVLVQDRAVASGLVWLIPGRHVGRRKQRHRTILVPTPRLQALALQHVAGTTVHSTRTFGRVYIRDTAENDKRYMRVLPDQTVKKMEAELREINDVTARFAVRRADGTLLPTEELWFDRSFNNGCLSDGGRAYAAFQSTPQAVRLTYTIDGEPVAELDYGAYHVRLVHHLAGLDCATKPYSDIVLDGVLATAAAVKGLFKPMGVILINTKDVKSANMAAARTFSRVTPTGEPKKKQPFPLPEGKKAADISAALLDHLPILRGLIADMTAGVANPGLAWMNGELSRGMGVKLQRIDGDLAVAIMLRFARMGKPCLGLHDSFIVKASDRDLLRQVMHEEYAQRFRFAPVIDEKTPQPQG